MYYSQNRFIFYFRNFGQTLPRVHKFVEDKQATIETHVRHIRLGIHHRVSDLSPYNKRLQHLFRSLPHRFLLHEARMGKPKPEWTDYALAKKEFTAKLKEEVMLPGGIVQEISDDLYDGVLLPVALELFQAVWLLAHTFPQANKSIYTLSILPVKPSFHMW